MTASFKASSFQWRLFAGSGVIESDLAAASRRHEAKRAFVICSPSIRSRTDLVTRVEATLGNRYAGCFDGIENDSTFRSVTLATEAARDAGADLLIAIGGGSVIVATRAVAIFLAETGSPFELMTQYPEDGGRPYSPRLMAPKLPIINIPTTPTSAMNRAGTGLKNAELDRRMEYFDPKTRPQSIIIDDDALMTAPWPLLRSTATTVYCSVIGSTAHAPSNPLVDADQSQAFRLIAPVYENLMEASEDAGHRRNLALAAVLQNRAEDDGRRLVGNSPFNGDYAVSTALHLFQPSIGQGDSTAVLMAHVIRLADQVDADQSRRVASALGVWEEGLSADAAAERVADKLEAVFRKLGMATRLRQLDLNQDDLPGIAAETVKNFNAIAGDSKSDEKARIDRSLRVLEAAW